VPGCRPEGFAWVRRARAGRRSCEIPIGAFEVRDVQRGTGVTVRTLPGGEPFFLRDRLFSSSVRRLDLFIGRILHDGTRPRLLAVPVPVDRSAHMVARVTVWTGFGLLPTCMTNSIHGSTVLSGALGNRAGPQYWSSPVQAPGFRRDCDHAG
jgi:hypothetical protein